MNQQQTENLSKNAVGLNDSEFATYRGKNHAISFLERPDGLWIDEESDEISPVWFGESHYGYEERKTSDPEEIDVLVSVRREFPRAVAIRLLKKIVAQLQQERNAWYRAEHNGYHERLVFDQVFRDEK